MFCYLMTAFTALLFVALTPGVLLTLPSKASSKLVIALVHGLIFALVYHLIHKTVKGVLHKYEGFDDDDDDEDFQDYGIEGFRPPPDQVDALCAPWAAEKAAAAAKAAAAKAAAAKAAARQATLVAKQVRTQTDDEPDEVELQRLRDVANYKATIGLGKHANAPLF